MKRNHTVTRNAVCAAIQVVISGTVLFLLYRYLLQAIGPEKLGVWAIVLATASASRLSELGFGGSAVKFVAKYIARGEKEKAVAVVQTTVITVGFILACVLVVGYPLIVWLMVKIIPATHSPDALEILPYALVSVWTGAVAGVFLSGLDGCQRADLRSLVSMLGAVLFLAFTWLLVPQYGLIGLACAQIAQGASLFLMSLMLLKRRLPKLPLFPCLWQYSIFREMLRYGINFQISSVAAMLFEPTTKALMVKFGGLTMTAYYEMANRMVMQFRLLLVSANQVMVPHVADLQENAPEKIRNAYCNSYRVLFFLALPLFAGIASIAPLASQIWIGRYEQAFVRFSLFLLAGHWLNTLTGPAYFFNLGIGSLRWNTFSHLAIGILNAVLGYLGGAFWGGGGVAMGYALALALGSNFIVIGYHRDNQLPYAKLLPNESKKLLSVCALSLLTGAIVFHFCGAFADPLWNATTLLAICAIPIFSATWSHPLRVKIMRKFAVGFGKSSNY